MRPRMFLPIVLFVAGIAAIAVTVASGETDVSLFLVFPIFSGSSAVFLIGILLIIASFIAGFAMLVAGVPAIEEYHTGAGEGTAAPQKGTEYGGVVLLGPIPIAFGSNIRIARTMLIVGIILAIVLIGLFIAGLFLL